MNDSDLHNLLRRADAANAANDVTDAFIAGVHRSAAHRRRRRQVVRVAGIAAVLAIVAVGVWQWPTPNASSPSVAVAPPLETHEDDASPSEPLLRLQVQLEQTAALMLARARRYEASEQTRVDAAAEYRRLIELFPNTLAAAEARRQLPPQRGTSQGASL